jgi:hypothetical protein
VSYSTPIDDDSRSPEEWVIGRFHAGSVDMEQRFFGANHFESEELAHESAAGHWLAVLQETLSKTLAARMLTLTRRELQVIRARFPWACDVKNAPDRDEELGEYLPGHQRSYPREHTRETIGAAMGVTAEYIRKLEGRADWKLTMIDAVVECSSEEFWSMSPAFTALNRAQQLIRLYWLRKSGRFQPQPRPMCWVNPADTDDPRVSGDQTQFDESLVDEFVAELLFEMMIIDLVCRMFSAPKKRRWLAPKIRGFRPSRGFFLYEEEVIQGKLLPRERRPRKPRKKEPKPPFRPYPKERYYSNKWSAYRADRKWGDKYPADLTPRRPWVIYVRHVG